MSTSTVARKEFVIHDTKSFFVSALDADEALDKYLNGEYHDSSDSDFVVEEWTP